MPDDALRPMLRAARDKAAMTDDGLPKGRSSTRRARVRTGGSSASHPGGASSRTLGLRMPRARARSCGWLFSDARSRDREVVPLPCRSPASARAARRLRERERERGRALAARDWARPRLGGCGGGDGGRRVRGEKVCSLLTPVRWADMVRPNAEKAGRKEASGQVGAVSVCGVAWSVVGGGGCRRLPRG
jgi:hypothetical protein